MEEQHMNPFEPYLKVAEAKRWHIHECKHDDITEYEVYKSKAAMRQRSPIYSLIYSDDKQVVSFNVIRLHVLSLNRLFMMFLQSMEVNEPEWVDVDISCFNYEHHGELCKWIVDHCK